MIIADSTEVSVGINWFSYSESDQRMAKVK